MTDMDTTTYAKATITLDDCVDVESALVGRDALKIWELARDAPFTDFYFSQVQHHAFNVVVREGSADSGGETTALPILSSYHSTVLWPIVLDRRLVEGNSALRAVLSEDSCSRVARLLNTLTATGEGSCVWLQAIGYGATCWAGPVVFRQLTDAMVSGLCGRKSGVLHGERIDMQRYPPGVPDDAPVLYFLLCAITAIDDWPQLAGSQDDRILDASQHLSATLRMELATHVQAMDWTLQVGTPALAAQAIEAGLLQWLKVLDQQYRFTRWTLETAVEDRIDLLVELEHGAIQGMRFPLRRYQIGMDGIERVIALVTEIVDANVSSCAPSASGTAH
jgi:hypothetical protein